MLFGSRKTTRIECFMMVAIAEKSKACARLFSEEDWFVTLPASRLPFKNIACSNLIRGVRGHNQVERTLKCSSKSRTSVGWMLQNPDHPKSVPLKQTKWEMVGTGEVPCPPLLPDTLAPSLPSLPPPPPPPPPIVCCFWSPWSSKVLFSTLHFSHARRAVDKHRIFYRVIRHQLDLLLCLWQHEKNLLCGVNKCQWRSL